MEPLLLEPFVLLLLVLANGVLAGAEIAIVAVRPTRVRELVAAGSRSAKALERLRHVPERFLSTVQVGITLVGATAGAYGGKAFAEDVEPWLARVPWLAPHAEVLAFVLVVALITYLSVVLGELVPKTLALRGSERYALLCARPLELLSWIATPVVFVLTTSSNAFLRLFGERANFTPSRHSLEELQALLDDATRGGMVDAEAGEIATRALDLGELTAGDVMVHRRFIAALPREAAPEQIRNTFTQGGHQRIPVHDGSIDGVLGYVSWRDVVHLLLRGEDIDLAALLRPCLFVPESKAAAALLEEMRTRRMPLAIAVDEHGGTAGLVTLEDLLEEIVGEITSEHGVPPPPVFERDGEGAAVVSGTAQIRDVNRELELELDEPRGQSTVGGLCIELAAGRIPAAGESFTTPDGTRIEVLDASLRRVRTVRIHPAPAPVVAEDFGS